MLSTLIGKLRVVGFLEGLSYLLLLGIAMPLKYIYDLPQMVQIVGMAHGILFIFYVLLAAIAKGVYKWSFGKLLLLWVASILPFGPFIADWKLLKPSEAKA